MALTATQQTVVDLYIAAYGRAPAQSGLDYFTNAIDSGDMTVAEVRDYMMNNTEAQNRYPAGNSAEENVTTVFQNVLGRAPATEEGLAYWAAKFDDPNYSMADLMEDVLNVAKSAGEGATDYETLANREAAAEYFLTTVPVEKQADNQPDLTTVTSDPATLESVKLQVNDLIVQDGGQTYSIDVDTTSVEEGSTIDFKVSLGYAVSQDTVLNYKINGVEIAGGTADPASDLGNVTGEVVIPAGATSATISITPKDDGVAEGFEGFNVVLLDNSFATVASSEAVVIKDGAEAGQSFILTTGTDTGPDFTGTSGNDVFSAVVGATSTLTAGDYLQGGDGDDTLNVSITGSATYNVAGVVMDSIENINVANYNTVPGPDVINLAQATGVKSINTIGTAATGDTQLTNVSAVVDSKMANGSGDLTVTYTDTAVEGTEDSATLTLANQTGGTYTVEGTTAGGIETLNVVSETAENTITVADTYNTIKTMNISGDQDLTITNNGTSLTTVDASAFTGDLDATLGSNAGTTVTVTGGSGDDTIALGNFDTTDIVDGGEGDDTLSIGVAITAASDLANVTNVETLQTTADVTLAEDANIMSFDFDNSVTNTLTLNTGVESAVSVKVDTSNETDNTVGDTVVNSANIALTVEATAAGLYGTTITGGTGTDVINVTADYDSTDGSFRVVDLAASGAITNVETITVVDGGDDTSGTDISGKDIKITTGAYATDLTIDASALDAANYDSNTDGKIDDTDASDEQLVVVGTGATGKLNIIGGAGADTITTGNGDDTVDTGAGDDSITSTAGNDTINAGEGDDTINMGNSLTADDTIDGGEGDDTLVVSTIDSDALANVSNIETLKLDSTTAVTLTSNLSFTTIDLTDDPSTNVATGESITFDTGYTNATTVNVDTADTVVNSANITLTLNGDAADLTGTLTGGTAVDTLNVTADYDSGDLLFTQVDLSTATNKITGIDKIVVVDGGDDASTGTNPARNDITINLTSYATALTIDASALDAASYDSNNDGKIDNTDDSEEKLTITGTAAKALNVTGGAGADTIVGSSDGTDGDTLNGGAGDDTIDMAGNLTYKDTVDGGEGSDTIKVDSGAADIDFMNVRNIEILTLTATVSANTTLSSYFDATGITTINTAAVTNTLDASGTTVGIKYVGASDDQNIKAGQGDDTFVFNSDILDGNDVIDGGDGTDTIELDNSAASVTAIVDLSNVTHIENYTASEAVGNSDTTSENISLTFSAMADDGTDSTDVVSSIDFSNITDLNDSVTVDASGVADTDYIFNIKGGAGDDTLSGGAAADTIDGGAGDDTIDAGAGADTITGGAGDDTFSFLAVENSSGTVYNPDSSSTATDTITDFVAGKDTLKVVADYSAETTNALTLDFTDKGDADSLSNGATLLSDGHMGQYFFDTTDNQLAIDTDGNGLIQATDLLITLTDATGFDSSDMNVVVTGGSAGDTITVGDGDDIIRAGGGADTVVGGAGDDTFVVLGTIAASDYTTADVTSDTGAYALGLADLIDTGLTVSDSGTDGTGETYTGGDGDDTLEIWGNADLSNATVSGIEHTDVHSNLTMSASQMLDLGQDISDGNFDINMLDPDSTFTMSGIASMGSDEINNLLGALNNTDFNIDSTLVANAVTNGSGLTVQTEAIFGVNYKLMMIANDGTSNVFFNGILSTQDSGSGVNVDYSGYATGQNLFILGSANNDTITATNNGDLIVETSGANTINGGAGNDIIVVTGGENTITGNGGVDYIMLGAGVDTVVIANGDAGTTGAEAISSYDASATGDKLDIAAATAVAVDVAAADVDVDGDTNNDYNISVTNGVVSYTALSGASFTVGSIADLVTLVEASGIDADETVAVEYNGSTYLMADQDGDGSLAITDVVQLTGVTGITAVDTTNADNTIFVG